MQYAMSAPSARSRGVTPVATTPPKTDVQVEDVTIEQDDGLPLYNIDCKKSSTINGEYSFQECKIVQVGGQQEPRNET